MADFAEVPDQPAYADEGRPRVSTATAPAQEEDRAMPVMILKHQQAEVYLEMLQRLIHRARLNQFYPSPNGLRNLYRLMTPSANRGLVDSVKINLRIGLPTEPEIGRVLADKDISQRFLQKHDFPELEQRSDDASIRLKKRVMYHLEVCKADLPRRTRLELKLRKVDENRRLASFIALWERYDPGEGVFVRYSISLTHQHNRWSRPQVELKGDDLKYTESFRNVISRYSSDEAEFAFVLLSEVPNIEVEEVVRCRVGPVWMDGVRMPVDVAELFKKHPGNFILNAPLERVSKEVKEDKNCDPFGRFYRASLAGDSKRMADERAELLGYKVFKERKFCCIRAIAGPFKDFLAQHGHRCVLYTV